LYLAEFRPTVTTCTISAWRVNLEYAHVMYLSHMPCETGLLGEPLLTFWTVVLFWITAGF